MEFFQILAGLTSHASPHIIGQGDNGRNKIKPVAEECQF